MIWEKVISGTLGSELSEPITYSTMKLYNPKKDDKDANPRVLLTKYLKGRLAQHPEDKIIPKSETVCSLLCDIIVFHDWNPVPQIPIKKYSRVKVEDLLGLIYKKCGVRVPKNELPDVGYQVEYFLELFKYIRGANETS